MPGESFSGGMEYISKKIPSEGPEWTKRRMEEQKEKESMERTGMESGQNIFGYTLLSTWELSKKKGRNWEVKKNYYPAVILKDVVERAKVKLDTLVESTQKELIAVAKARPRLFKQLIESYLADATTLAAFEKFVPKKDLQMHKLMVSIEHISDKNKSIDTITREHLARILVNQYRKGKVTITVKELSPLLEHHRDDVLAKEKELEKELEEYREKIKSLLLRASEHGTLPVSKEQIEERLNGLQFKAVDELTAVLNEMWGDFQSEQHLIRLSTDIPPESRWVVFVHEVMHAVSGQMENKVTAIYEEEDEMFADDPTMIRYEVTKVGTHFNNPTKNFESPDRDRLQLYWLNEAITEQITGEMVETGATSYEDERELLGLFIAAGIPKDVFYSAYFESYTDKQVRGEHKLPHTKSLFTTTNKLLGKGFLTNLDQFIAMYNKSTPGIKKLEPGVQIAVERWKELGSAFPAYLQDFLQEDLSET